MERRKMEILYGMLGFAFCLLAFVLGVNIGAGHLRAEKKRFKTAEQDGEHPRSAADETEEAYMAMLNYSAEKAYGKK